MINILMLMDICLFINSFSVKLHLVSYKKTDKPGYNWIQVTTSNYEWLQLTTSQTTGDYEPDYKWLQSTTSEYQWLQVTTNDCKQLPVKLRVTTTGIGNNLRHKKVYRSYDYTTMNEINTLKSVLKLAFGENDWKILAIQK